MRSAFNAAAVLEIPLRIGNIKVKD